MARSTCRGPSSGHCTDYVRFGIVTGCVNGERIVSGHSVSIHFSLVSACCVLDKDVVQGSVIDSYIADDFGNIFSLMQDEEFGLADAEKEFFGIDHAEVGGLIARSWNFPDPLIHAIENHHADINATSKKDLAAWTGFTNLVYHLSSIYTSIDFRSGITVGIEKEILDDEALSIEQ